jgi:hypothetical protein
MMTYGGEYVYIRSLPCTLDEEERSDLSPGHFTCAQRSLIRGLDVFQIQSSFSGEENKLCLHLESNQDSQGVQPVT